jgi:hypothetical protein
MSDAKLLHEFEGWIVCVADEVIETLDGVAIEVEVSGHASGLGRGFDKIYLMTIFDSLICGRQTHDSCSNNKYSRHRIKILGPFLKRVANIIANECE